MASFLDEISLQIKVKHNILFMFKTYPIDVWDYGVITFPPSDDLDKLLRGIQSLLSAKCNGLKQSHLENIWESNFPQKFFAIW